MSLNSCLYVGSVFHRRVRPKSHHFRYRLFWLLVDLDELAELDRRLATFSHNRLNFFSLFDRDYGAAGKGPLRPQVERLLSAKGVDLGGGPIRLLTMPRTCGYGFNPLSVYFCAKPDAALAAIVYEVHNTFGGRHAYVLPVEGPGAVRQSCAKTFFVSPFLPMELRYDFLVRPPGDTVSVAVRVSAPEGAVMRAALAGERRDLTDAALMKAGLAAPLEAMKTTAAIHWEALRLWAKDAAVPERGSTVAR